MDIKTIIECLLQDCLTAPRMSRRYASYIADLVNWKANLEKLCKQEDLLLSDILGQETTKLLINTLEMVKEK